MEFGATHCLPQNPKCESCIFKRACIAFARDWQGHLPVKTKKPTVRKRYFYYFVIVENSRLLMRKRTGKDIWQGLYDFYLVETKQHQSPEILFRGDDVLGKLSGKIRFNGISGPYKHVLTHQNLFTRFIPVEIKSTKADLSVFKSEKLKFYSSKEIDKLPKPVLVSRYLKEGAFL
jgi:A/G-specific adenine glycosylase